jgi:aminoglycoside/choline kinase family phosphotransferase
MSRNAVLERWLHQVLGNSEFQQTPLRNDCSFRKYYRIVVDNTSLVVMDAPFPETPATFVDIAKILKRQGLSVPDILHQDLGQGFLVLTDFGDRLYLPELNQQTSHILYQDAMGSLIQMQQCPTDHLLSFEPSFLAQQLGIFKEWYVEQHLKISMTFDIDRVISSLAELFAKVIEEQPQVFVHRDYHSRNLMILDNKNPGILDFQDAMKGPLTYDLASLLQDCYISWPRASVEHWVSEFQDSARLAGLLSGADSREQFLRWFDLTGLQRHLKNLGIFSRLHHRDGKSRYLKDIPMLLKYIKETIDRYSELQFFSSFFDQLSKKNTLCAETEYP